MMKSLIPCRFLPHCESRGIKLLAEDIKFLEKYLRKVPLDLRRGVLTAYLDEFELGQGLVCKDAPDVLKQNKGRFRANVWLRTEGIARR